MRYKKFERDYWGSTLKELIEDFKIDNKKNILISTCGTNDALVEKYFKKKGYFNIRFVSAKNSEYTIMTNRTTSKKQKVTIDKDITNCFDKNPGKNISVVERNGQILSIIRKVN